MSMLIRNARPLQFHPVAAGDETDVFIEGGVIRKMGRGLEAQLAGCPIGKVLDASGKWLVPGNVCAHHHFYSTLARGILADIPPSFDFVGVLQNLWWRLDRALDEPSLYFSGLIGALEAIKAGTTSVIDHNASPSFIRGSLRVLKSAFDRCGLRGLLCYEVTDRNGPGGRDCGIEENLSFVRSEETETIRGAVGAHASFTLSDESMGALAEAVSRTSRGIHIHAAEDVYDLSESHHRHGMSPVERLDKFHLLDRKSLIIHGVHLLDRDVDLINRRDAFLVHNPRSNMNNSVGYCTRLQGLNRVALGTDGIGSDMFEETRIGYFKASDSGRKLWPVDLMRFLVNGNEIMERYFRKRFGRVEEGFIADLVLLDYPSPTPLVVENAAGHFLFGLSAAAVDTAIINGTCVYENRKFPFDIQPIYEEACREAVRMWERIGRF